MSDFWKSIETFDPHTADPHFCWALLQMEEQRYLRIKNGKVFPTEKLMEVSPQTILDQAVPAGQCKAAQGLLTAEAEGFLTIKDGICTLTEAGKQRAIDQELDEALAKERARCAKKVRRNDPCPCGSGLKFKHCCLRRQTD